jgi:hypothetical protein
MTESGATFETVNPATEQVIANVAAGDKVTLTNPATISLTFFLFPHLLLLLLSTFTSTFFLFVFSFIFRLTLIRQLRLLVLPLRFLFFLYPFISFPSTL